MDYLQAIEKNFTSIQLSSAVKDYLRAASMRVHELFGRPLELYFYLLTNNQGSAVRVTHAYIPWGQKLSRTSCSLTLEGKLRSYGELGDLPLLGWAHSHGEMPAFHSDTDNANTLARLNDCSLEAVCESEIKEQDIHLIDLAEGTSLVRLTEVKYTYSIVLSLKEVEHYGAVGIKGPDGREHLLRDIPVKIVEGEEGEGAVQNDFDGLDEEILAKVSVDGQGRYS